MRDDQLAVDGEGVWAHVVVFKSSNETVVVNVFGCPTLGKARYSQRRAKEEAEQLGLGERLIANRVRPVLDSEFYKRPVPPPREF